MDALVPCRRGVVRGVDQRLAETWDLVFSAAEDDDDLVIVRCIYIIAI